MDFGDYFKGKKVTVMGLGLLGRGVGDALYLAECGAEVIVTDLKSKEELASSVVLLEGFSNITFVLGEHRHKDFNDRDFILVVAGVPLDSPYLETARKEGIPLKQSAALFAEISKVPIIGVTGTRGKSTITHMIHHVLSITTDEPILLGGNVRGVSNLQLLKEVKEDSLCVMELDSWQLQGFGWAEISPQIAVFSNFMPDHLNYYQTGGKSFDEAMDVYFKDKAQIFLHQEESGVLITTPEVFARAKKLEGTLGQEVVLVDNSIIPEDVLLAMPGEHNRLNAALAYEALIATGLQEEEIFNGLASFPGVSGRLEYVTEVNGVRIYNDNNATTPAATTAGIVAIAAQKNVILICGGSDKGLAVSTLAEAIKAHVARVIVTPGTGTDRLLAELKNTTIYDSEIIAAETLSEALAEARLVARAGDVILFSPGFASFAQYNNEYERNDEFMKIIASHE